MGTIGFYATKSILFLFLFSFVAQLTMANANTAELFKVGLNIDCTKIEDWHGISERILPPNELSTLIFYSDDFQIDGMTINGGFVPSVDNTVNFADSEDVFSISTSTFEKSVEIGIDVFDAERFCSAMPSAVLHFSSDGNRLPDTRIHFTEELRFTAVEENVGIFFDRLETHYPFFDAVYRPPYEFWNIVVSSEVKYNFDRSYGYGLNGHLHCRFCERGGFFELFDSINKSIRQNELFYQKKNTDDTWMRNVFSLLQIDNGNGLKLSLSDGESVVNFCTRDKGVIERDEFDDFKWDFC